MRDTDLIVQMINNTVVLRRQNGETLQVFNSHDETNKLIEDIRRSAWTVFGPDYSESRYDE